MEISAMVKRLQDIMRNDAGVNGDAQRIEQMAWLLFLKIYDEKEKFWALQENGGKSVIPESLRWRCWAADKNDGKEMTGDELTEFINGTLFPYLKAIKADVNASMNEIIVKNAFENAYNYMKDGFLLRQVINVINELKFIDHTERHDFNEIYENILKDLQNQRSSGEFYTPRALTDFMTAAVNPKLTDKIADFACGTGGFLTSALKHLEPQVKTAADRRKYNESVFGVEKKSLPHLLCVTNMLLHDIYGQNILHGNSLENNVYAYDERIEGDCFDVILMNPPYGGKERENIKNNFPAELRSSETACLFIALIFFRLKQNGRAGIILPDSFMFGTDSAKTAIKKKLFNEFNLHTVIRLPRSVFAPYTLIATNILFFDKTGSTKETWFYRMDMPEECKNFTKKRPVQFKHFAPVLEWLNRPVEIFEYGFHKAKKYSADDIKAQNYNINLCGFPHEEEEIFDPNELIERYAEKKDELNKKADSILSEIMNLLEE